MVGKKKPNPIDVHVGSRVRFRRMGTGMSQEKLGEHLGITFQQIQKYEKGTNRIGASRLQSIARVLQVSVSFFFDGAPGATGDNEQDGFQENSSSQMIEFLSTSEGIQLTRAFAKISDVKIRRRIIDLVSSLADDDGDKDI